MFSMPLKGGTTPFNLGIKGKSNQFLVKKLMGTTKNKLCPKSKPHNGWCTLKNW